MFNFLRNLSETKSIIVVKNNQAMISCVVEIKFDGKLILDGKL